MAFDAMLSLYASLFFEVVQRTTADLSVKPQAEICSSCFIFLSLSHWPHLLVTEPER